MTTSLGVWERWIQASHINIFFDIFQYHLWYNSLGCRWIYLLSLCCEYTLLSFSVLVFKTFCSEYILFDIRLTNLAFLFAFTYYILSLSFCFQTFQVILFWVYFLLWPELFFSFFILYEYFFSLEVELNPFIFIERRDVIGRIGLFALGSVRHCYVSQFVLVLCI
jgi:hypothetical protein